VPPEEPHDLRRPDAATPATVLVVDDAAFVRNWAGEVLARHGHRVLVASGADEALALARTETIDVVVSDVVMPRTDGLDLVAQLHELVPGIPAILMSAYSERIALKGAAVEGRYLQKPFPGADLIAAVELALGPRAAA
jgi:DNA-binding NtrC family response regulator